MIMIPTTKKSFQCLSGSAFEKMDMATEFAALSRDELKNLLFRGLALLSSIHQHVKNTTSTTSTATTDFSAIFLSVAECLQIKPLDIAALSIDELEQWILRSQDIIRRSPIKPGNRFFEALPEEYILEVLLEWITIEELAQFDTALLNNMDRKAYPSLLRDTEHKGVLSVSGSYGYDFDSGVVEWLENRNVFMRALAFHDSSRDIPAGFLARTGRQLLEIDLAQCEGVTDAGVAELAGNCPNLEVADLQCCHAVSDDGLAKLLERCPRIHSLNLSCTSLTGKGLARFLEEGGRALKKLHLYGLDISDSQLFGVATGCPNLEDVRLESVHGTTYTGLAYLLMRCPKLHMLDISRTREITGDGHSYLGESCRALRKITLSCSAITDAGLGKIAKACPNLEYVDLSQCGSITDEGLALLLMGCPRIHTLILRFTKITGGGLSSLGEIQTLDLSHTKITAEGLSNLGGGGEAMKKIDLGCCVDLSDAGLGKIASACPGLEEVNLAECGKLSDAALALLLMGCPRIHTLILHSTKITGGDISSLGEGCSSMKKITFSGCQALSDAGLGMIAEACPNLEDVDLSQCESITDAGLTLLLMRCPLIHTLYISGTTFSGEAISTLEEGCGALKKITFGGCQALSDAGLGKIASACPGLENVCLYSCAKISDAGLANLLIRCPLIHTLYISDTTFSGEAISTLGEGCGAMKKIEIGWNQAISDAGLGNIAKACSNLEDVSLYRNDLITDKGLANLLMCCPKLRSLHVSHFYMKSTTVEGLAELAVAYPRIITSC